MSDSTTPFGTIAIGQGDQAAKANALFDASAPVAIYAKKYATTTGLTLAYHGGKISVNGVVTVIADGTLALKPDLLQSGFASPVYAAFRLHVLTGFCRKFEPAQITSRGRMNAGFCADFSAECTVSR
jgi:hypothetical protein